ncbi:MAG: hypothetical protein ACOYYJ_00615 [Chloroflexota bacterium]
MPDFNESNLCFSFGNEWEIIKVDDHPDYRSVFQTIPGTKSVDFLGLHQRTVYFIEVKNYSASLTSDEPKLKGDDLPTALAQKFRDTLFIVLAAHCRYHRPDWHVYALAIGQDKPIKYVAWIELDYQFRHNVERKRLQALWSILSQKLKRKLGRLNQFDPSFQAMVISSVNASSTLHDLSVRDAPC